MAVRWKRVFLLTVVVLMAVIFFAPPVFAAPDSGQVSTAIESTWKTAATQIKTVTNNVIFPVVDCVLAILFFGLVFAITAPTYIWNILGI